LNRTSKLLTEPSNLFVVGAITNEKVDVLGLLYNNLVF
jgi:hypothetical protein